RNSKSESCTYDPKTNRGERKETQRRKPACPSPRSSVSSAVKISSLRACFLGFGIFLGFGNLVLPTAAVPGLPTRCFGLELWCTAGDARAAGESSSGGENAERKP